jgi:calcium-dependent protein kinase
MGNICAKSDNLSGENKISVTKKEKSHTSEGEIKKWNSKLSEHSKFKRSASLKF